MSNKQADNAHLYIGLMSGTSADGIDLALVDFSNNQINFKASYYQAYSQDLHQKITKLYLSSDNELDYAYSLDIELAKIFADSINHFLTQQGLSASDIIAIGNHGQTIRHRPEFAHPFTVQIGCNQTLACLTNIRVIGDFRKKDLIFGGQGAPLVPAFHHALFLKESGKAQQKTLAIVNIGGIANISYLPADIKQNIVGFDTGPGNALLDAWYQQHNSNNYDDKGHWAKQGKVIPSLLKSLMADAYFQKAAPKSTGREYFHLPWLLTHLADMPYQPEDVQATLVELTAQTITNEIKKLHNHSMNTYQVYLCGGGTLNYYLVEKITEKLEKVSVKKISDLGIDNDALEAMAFAWFAYAFDHKIIGNIPHATGATKSLVLGAEYKP